MWEFARRWPRRRAARRLHARDVAAAGRAEAQAQDHVGQRPIERIGLPDALKALPLLVIAAITLADVATPSGVRFDPMLAAAPALAAAICGVGGTIAVALIAFGAHGALATYHGAPGSLASIVDFLALASVAAAGVLAAYVRQRRERQLAGARSVAEATQRALLRPMPDQVGQLRVAAAYLAAQAEARIGGDLYDAAHTRHGERILVGDVQGKGLPAVDTAAALLGAFREAAYHEPSLPRLLRRLEAAVRRQAARGSEGDVFAERFVTAVVVQVDADGPAARLVNCGHPQPMLVRAGAVTPVEAPAVSPPLGLGALAADGYQPVRFAFQPGDMLLLYTDGVTEARNRAGVFYPLLERAAPAARAAGGSPSTLITTLVADLLDHAGGQLSDDAAMVVIALPATDLPAAGATAITALGG